MHRGAWDDGAVPKLKAADDDDEGGHPRVGAYPAMMFAAFICGSQ